MSYLALLSGLALVACAADPQAPPPSVAVVPVGNVAPPLPPPPPPPTPTLAGTIGGQRFIAQSALLVRVNEGASAGSSVFPGQTFQLVWSFLLVFDRVLTCADIGKSMLPKSGVAGERFVKYQVQGQWPFAPGRSFAIGSDPRKPQADGFSGNIWSGQSGSVLRGTMRVVAASMSTATLEMDAATTTSGTETSGALRGTVAVVVCP